MPDRRKSNDYVRLNRLRATKGFEILLGHSGQRPDTLETDATEAQDALTDLLADLAHWAHKHPAVTFDRSVRAALRHVSTELAREATQVAEDRDAEDEEDDDDEGDAPGPPDDWGEPLTPTRAEPPAVTAQEVVAPPDGPVAVRPAAWPPASAVLIDWAERADLASRVPSELCDCSSCQERRRRYHMGQIGMPDTASNGDDQ